MLPSEWENFKERMKKIVPEINVAALTEDDFTAGAWQRWRRGG